MPLECSYRNARSHDATYDAILELDKCWCEIKMSALFAVATVFLGCCSNVIFLELLVR